MVLHDTHAEHEPNVAPEVVVKPRGSQDLPEVAQGPEGLAQKGIHSPELGTYSREKELASVPTDTPKKKLCGMRRGFAIGLIVAILVVIATVGGAVGGILASKNKTHNAAASEPPPSGAPSDTSGSNNTGATVEAPEPMRNIFATQSQRTIFNFWQKSNGELWMHSYWQKSTNVNQKWSDPMKLELDIPAMNNTPLAAATWPGDGNFAIHLHYQSASSRSPSSLLLTCLTNSTSCTFPNTTSLSASPALAPGSGFTLLAPATNTLRAYTINSASILCEAAWDAKLRTWSAPSAINGNPKAHASSPIAAGLVGTDIWLFYFDEQKRLMSLTSAWKSGTWSIAQLISPSPAPAQLPRALGIAVSGAPAVVQVFYFSGTKIQQVHWSSNTWSTGDIGTGVLDASVANGPLGMVGWNGTAVRMYYPVGTEGASRIREIVGSEKWVTGGHVDDEY